jgi:hypothetical protein
VATNEDVLSADEDTLVSNERDSFLGGEETVSEGDVLAVDDADTGKEVDETVITDDTLVDAVAGGCAEATVTLERFTTTFGVSCSAILFAS